MNPMNSLVKFDRLLDKACSIGLSKKTKIEDVYSGLSDLLKDHFDALAGRVAFFQSDRQLLEKINRNLKILNSKKFPQVKNILERIDGIKNHGDKINKTCIKHGIEPRQFAAFMGPFSHVNATDKKGQTPLGAAISLGDDEMVKLLLELGADVNQLDGEGASPLRRAVVYNAKTEIFELLKKKGADLKLIERDGMTAFCFAAAEGKLDIVKTLVRLGADIHQKFKVKDGSTVSETTPLIEALGRQRTDVVAFLESRGTDKGVALEYLRKKFLAHVWGISGVSSVVKEGTTYVFSREGHHRQFVMKTLSGYVKEFFSSGMASFLSKENRERIEKVIDNTFPISSESLKQLASRAQAGEPVAILGGSSDHSISMVLFQGRLAICNRGGGKSENAVEYFELPSKEVSEELMAKLTQIYSSPAEFNTCIKSLNLKHLGGFKQKDQKVGNCAVASGKGIVGILFCMMTGDERSGRALYKQFTAFLRQKVLLDFFAQYTSKVDGTLKDDGLLAAITEKSRVKMMRRLLRPS